MASTYQGAWYVGINRSQIAHVPALVNSTAGGYWSAYIGAPGASSMATPSTSPSTTDTNETPRHRGAAVEGSSSAARMR